MKMLGLSAGATRGSAEICLKEALRAATGDGLIVDMVRLGDLRLPTTTDDDGPDDGPWLWEQMLECDALVVSTPIYTRTVSARLKVMIDRLLGPNADSAIIERVLERRRRGDEAAVPFRVDERVLRPRVAGFIAVGGALTSQWKTLALPIMHTATLSMNIAVVDQVVIGGAGTPKSVVLDADALMRCATLGHHVASQVGRSFADVRYLGDPGLCPECHLDVVILRGRSVECATCGARGVLDDGHQVRWTDFSGCVIRQAERFDHYDEIVATAERHRVQQSHIAELAAAYDDFEPISRPPGSQPTPRNHR